jgi:hypothetical protein
MMEQISCINENQTWDFQELPQGAKAITCRWVFKLKEEIGHELPRKESWLPGGSSKEEKLIFQKLLPL